MIVIIIQLCLSVSYWDASEKACDRVGSVRQCDVLSFDINKRLQSEDACEVAAEGQGQTGDQRSRVAENCERSGRWEAEVRLRGRRRTPGAADAREAGEKRLSRHCVFIS